MWAKKAMPLVDGLENSSATTAKRWLDFYLNELLDDRYPVREQAAVMDSKRDICDFVIEEIDYPLVRGVPRDTHKDNWFGGLCCYTIDLDFWQQASETLRTLRLGEANGKKGYGDCEDASLLFVDLFLVKGWKAFECFGQVYEGSELLGGHGWGIFEDDKGDWRLFEATLDEAPIYPSGYPIIVPESSAWKIGDLTYSGLVKFNRDEYFESEGGIAGLSEYLTLKVKETKKKYQAIQRAWQAPVKPIARGGILGKLRRF